MYYACEKQGIKFQICEEQGVSTFLKYNFKLHVHADIHIMTTGSFLEKKTPWNNAFHICTVSISVNVVLPILIYR